MGEGVSTAVIRHARWSSGPPGWSLRHRAGKERRGGGAGVIQGSGPTSDKNVGERRVRRKGRVAVCVTTTCVRDYLVFNAELLEVMLMPRSKRRDINLPSTDQTNEERLEITYHTICDILNTARSRALDAVNNEMVKCYWHVGRIIVEEEQYGKERADYGVYLMKGLSKRLIVEFGKGYRKSNLYDMRNLYLLYPKFHALPGKLTWTHYRLLLRLENPDARSFYEQEAVNANWSTRELERQINSLLFERLALSRDKKGVKELAQKGHEIHQPSDLIKDP